MLARTPVKTGMLVVPKGTLGPRVCRFWSPGETGIWVRAKRPALAKIVPVRVFEKTCVSLRVTL